MSRRNIEDSHPVILKCAMLITGFSFERFQSKEVLFQIDLVKNLFRASNHFADFQLQPLQIMRLFEKYASLDWAVIHAEKGQKLFQFRPAGLFSLLDSLVVMDYVLPTAEAIFLQWFIDAYRPFILARLKDRVSAEDQARLNEILGPQYIFRHQLTLIKEGVRDLELRIRESDQLQDYLKRGQEKGQTAHELVRDMPDEFSYRLSHQKRFRDWLLDLPEEVREYEIREGIGGRQQKLYRLSLDALTSRRGFYQGLIA